MFLNHHNRTGLDTFIDSCQSLYPDITWITTSVFMEMRGDRPWVIVDVRTEVEREVSIIPGSISLVDYLQHADGFGGRPVLVYCTVGCRSASHTHSLREQGVEAYNLWGGVVDWAEYGGKFTTLAGKPTNEVHTHGRRWDLLPPAYKAVW